MSSARLMFLGTILILPCRRLGLKTPLQRFKAFPGAYLVSHLAFPRLIDHHRLDLETSSSPLAPKDSVRTVCGLEVAQTTHEVFS